MTRPIGTKVTKDNSKKNYAERNQWTKGKRLGRPRQRWIWEVQPTMSGDVNHGMWPRSLGEIMTVRLEDGSDFEPLPEHEVRCEEHNFVTTWGELDPIQQLAVESGLDIEGPRCILAKTVLH